MESLNSAVKREFGKALRSKNRVAQENELLAKLLAYNLTVLIHEMFRRCSSLGSAQTGSGRAGRGGLPERKSKHFPSGSRAVPKGTRLPGRGSF